jgi:hypothetical protein
MLLGLPALSLSILQAEAGLPLGVQLEQAHGAYRQGSQQRATNMAMASMISLTSAASAVYGGQIQPVPLGLGKQPTDCGKNIFGNHSTTFGNNTTKPITKMKTM